MNELITRVLIIEDNEALSQSLSATLARYSIICDIAHRGNDGIMLVQKYEYDAIVVDLMLPDVDGFQILLKLRTLRIKVPVIIISGLSTAEQKIRGLQSGADDYLTKPFDHHELVARLRAICRRAKTDTQTVLKFDQVVVKPNDFTITVGTKKLKLTRTEHTILVLLATNQGTVLPKETFIEHIYKDSPEPQSKVIDVFICRLREKLRQVSGKDYIGTVWGVGYVLRDQQDLNYKEPNSISTH